MAPANPSRVSTVRMVLHRRAIEVFRRLPLRVRRKLVRLGTPNYTLGSVVLLRDHDDRLLLVRQPPSNGWSLPGGLLDRHEHPRDAAVRELREEIGVTLEPEAVTPIVPNAHVNPFVQQVDLIFTATVDADATEVAVDQVEIGEARWFPLDELPPLTGPTFRLLGRAGLVTPDASPARPTPASEPSTSTPDAAEQPNPAGSAAGSDRQPTTPSNPPAAGDTPSPASASDAANATDSANATGAPGLVLEDDTPGPGGERTEEILGEPGEAFADPEATQAKDATPAHGERT